MPLSIRILPQTEPEINPAGDCDLTLDNRRISARSFYASGSILPGGLKCKRHTVGVKLPEGAKRGVIQGFTPAARRRMLDVMMGIPWGELAAPDKYTAQHHTLFVTLTYPEEWPQDWPDWKRHLRTWQKRLDRWCKKQDLTYWGVWKLELQERGAPHFHILLSLSRVVSVRGFRDRFRRAWYEIVESGDKNHSIYGCNCNAVYENKRGALMRYLSKYLGKAWIAARETGRVWGMWGDVPQVNEGDVQFITRGAWVEFQRRLRKWGRRSRYLAQLHNSPGLRLFGEGMVLVQLLRGLDVVVESGGGSWYATDYDTV